MDNYCPSCETEVAPVKRDFGIGSYEYWGSKEVHRDVRIVCPECETEVENPELPEPDHDYERSYD